MALAMLVGWLSGWRWTRHFPLSFPSVTAFPGSPHIPQRTTHSVWRQGGLRGLGRQASRGAGPWAGAPSLLMPTLPVPTTPRRSEVLKFSSQPPHPCPQGSTCSTPTALAPAPTPAPVALAGSPAAMRCPQRGCASRVDLLPFLRSRQGTILLVMRLFCPGMTWSPS